VPIPSCFGVRRRRQGRAPTELPLSFVRARFSVVLDGAHGHEVLVRFSCPGTLFVEGFAMSGIGSVGSSNAQLLQFLQGLAGGSANQDASNDGDADDAAAVAAPSATAGAAANPLTDLRKQIEAAVIDAVKNFDPANSTSSLGQTIKDAVDKTLQANGVDPSQLPASPHHGGHHRHHADAAQSSDPSGQSLFDLLGNGDGSSGDPPAAGVAGAGSGTQPNDSALLQIFAQIFQNSPNGTAVDAQA
jgi:hypothetical protein